MRRRYRIITSVLAAAVSVGLVIALVFLGSATEGPIGTALQAIGSVVSGVESRVVQRIRGPGRAQQMAFLNPMRSNADSLRSPGRMLLGAYDATLPGSLDGVLELEDSLHTRFGVIQVYTAWGDRPDQRFPTRILQAIRDMGSIPMVTWEPWLTDFENRLHPHLPLRDARDRGGLAAIAEGAYDFYIDAWARDAAAFRTPLLLRFGHEFNDPYRYPWGPHNNHPNDFILAWRRIVDRFRAAGADNVVWVWAPHIAYEGFEWYYPGDEYVDWVGTGVLNYGTVAHWSRWWTFDEIFGQRYESIAQYGKPIMIAEFGSLAVGGSRAEWFDAALRDLHQRFPRVHAVLFFHVGSDRTVTYQALDWSLTGDAASLASIREAVRGWPDVPDRNR